MSRRIVPAEPPPFVHGRDLRGNLRIGVNRAEPVAVGFRSSVHPQFRFPLWAEWEDPDALFWLKDADLPAVYAHLRRQGVVPERSPMEVYYMLLVHWRGGMRTFWRFPRGPNEAAFELHYGFAGMPAPVAKSLFKGEMQWVQRICGWRRIEFYDDDRTPCLAQGYDGSTWSFDEQGRTIGFEIDGVFSKTPRGSVDAG